MIASATSNSGIHDITSHGAVGDGLTLSTPAIQQAIDTCHESGGGTVFVPAGVYITGTIYLKSHVTLHLLAGATLRGSSRREDYNADDIFPENPVFAQENVTGAHLIIAYKAEHVAIVGEGTIDGNSSAFFAPLPAAEMNTTYQRKTRNFPIRDWRPGQMVFFCRCTNVAVRDIALENSTYWTLFLLGCRSVQIRGLRITNPPQTQNGDGIDIDCSRDVTVSDCIIHSGDDAITLRGHNKLLGSHAQPCEHVAVTNCVLSSPCCAIRVGVGDGIVRNCSFSNIIVKETRTGINMIAAYSDKSAHGVTIENIHFANFTMDTVVPLNVLLGQYAKQPAAIRNISFSHFRALGQEGCYIGGNEGHHISDIRLHEVELQMTGGDVDPDFADRIAQPTGGNRVPAGIFMRHIDRLRVSGLRIVWHKVTGAWQNAVVIEKSDDVIVSWLEATPPPTEAAGEMLHCVEVNDLKTDWPATGTA